MPSAEKLHQLSRKILVGMSLAVGRSIEPRQERRVVDRGAQQVAERRSGQRSKHLVLAPHRRQVVDLLVAGCEVIVPHQRQPFTEWVRPAQHAKNPPGLQAFRIIRTDRRVRECGAHLPKTLGHQRCPHLSFENSADTGRGAVFQVTLNLRPRGGKTRPAVEMHNPSAVPRSFGGRMVDRPWILCVTFQGFISGLSMRDCTAPRSLVSPGLSTTRSITTPNPPFAACSPTATAEYSWPGMSRS